jgi:blocked-early-in-transport protein 1
MTNRHNNNNQHNDANQDIMESQNNERISQLSDQVSLLKNLTIDIGNEVSSQNNLLDDMGTGFGNTQDVMGRSMKRLGTMLNKTSSMHLCWMVGFIFFVMVFLWWSMTSKH